MAIISSNIENLKPDQEYLVTVRAINSDVNVASNYTDTIRFKTPTDSTIPSAPTNLELAVSFFNVLFKYTDSQDNDIEKYEYELYQDTQIELVNSIYQPKSGQTPHRTGFVQTNIFLVSIGDNSYTTSPTSVTNPIKYYGRVRSVDTSNNVGDWTQLAESDDTPLIDEQYIGSLTAAKITAGEIGAHTITLSGGTGPGTYSIIKSSTYDFTSPTEGWYIRGDGHFSLGGPNGITYDNSTIVIGTDVQVQANFAADSIIVGTSPNQLKINDAINGGNGGMTLGDATYNYWYADGKFRTGNDTNYMLWNGTSLTIRGTLQFPDGTTPGTFDNGDALTSGSISGLTINATKLFYGTGTFGNANTPFYVDTASQFSLGSKLKFANGDLSISGTISAGIIEASTFRSNDNTTQNRIEIIPDRKSGTANADSIRFYSGYTGETSSNSSSIRNEDGILILSGAGVGATTQRIEFRSQANGVRFTGPIFMNNSIIYLGGSTASARAIEVVSTSQHILMRAGSSSSAASAIKVLGSADGIQARNGSDGSYTQMRASAFTVSSSYEVKTDIVLARQSLDTILSTNVYEWKYISEKETRPDDERITRVFPVAEDLPNYLLSPSLDDEKIVDIRDIAGLLWKGMQELNEKISSRLDAIEVRLQNLE